ncbi:protein translocase subunit SecDF [Flavitalea sp. BT771]|uniref:protein translocase subunit SecDF n=1 Tax=Flavitalea sp. BT771 TaxID=3063329 RepID=UPI0026E3C177|nr:protein translocase subunit SecDF [Flavitalea sp. BT771]MDO6431200.1 protein translocase subunit SecDF [Flavitalea sp. BT771]MDV6220107.1 protein translocase subunit SecDF [Flavitalea sp. BT771]
MRALVGLFAALLIVISLYQLSFTWFVNSHESAMEAKAKRQINSLYPSAATKYPGNKEAQALYQDTIDEAFNLRKKQLLDSTRETKITWWGTTYQKSKESELLLGLDLQGGISVTLDVALDGLIKGLANNSRDPQLLKALDLANKRKVSSSSNLIDLFAQSYKELNPNGKLAPLFANANRNKLKFEAADDDVITYLHGMASAAMKQTYKVLQTRIDKFGVAQPSISLDENRGIISVELAGATDPERVRNYLQSTANLQFWEVYNLGELETSVVSADKALENYLTGVKADTAVAGKDSTAKSKNDSLAANDPNAHPLLNQRVIHFIQPQQDPKTGQPRYAAYLAQVLLKDTGTVNSWLNNPVVRNNFPQDLKFLWGKQGLDDNGKPIPVLDLYAIKTLPGTDKARIEGAAIEDATQDFDQMTSEVLVEMSMNKQGAKAWADMTTKNTGKPIAIVLDDIVYSAPFVNEPITGGQSRITMGRSGGSTHTIEDAQDLANIIKTGKLDAPAKIVQEYVVGPTLGKEAVHGGTMAFTISFVVIFILMLVYYNTAGWVANIALVLNLLFTIGVLSSLHATLTAPGIAGLVLTIGMAVDTNVIIFERIKEELTRGKSYQLAVSDGYKRSLAPVLDAHVTTLLTALILFYFGLGPVLGFATTQILGILLSLFCGILVSRLITDFYTNKNRHFKYFTPLSRRIFKHASFKFIEYRKVAYFISVVVLILGVSSFFHGFKEGVEFRGGRSYVINFHKPVEAVAARDALKKAMPDASLEIKTYGSNEQLEITTDYRIQETGNTIDSAVLGQMYVGLKPLLPGVTASEFATNKYVQSNKTVLPTISDDLKSGAVKAVIFAIIIIFLYIFIRFRDWRYSLGTIIALLHDVFVTLAVFSFLHEVVPFPLEMDQHFIAAVLTVVGFSMNDTVIVFDRIREDSRLMKGASNATIINKAINDTLSRTIMTSLTVFLTILILFLVGGEVTRGFAFAMLIGVITGTYSSIFVAAPFLVDFAKGKPLGAAGQEPAEKAKAAPATTTRS